MVDTRSKAISIRMVNTRSRASKRHDRGNKGLRKTHRGGSEASPVQTSGENSIGHPIAPQFVAVDQLGEALKQVQEVLSKGAPDSEVGSGHHHRGLLSA